MIRECIKCGDEFDDKHPNNKRGRINECGPCAGRDVERYVGLMDAGSKSGSHINIFRTGIKTASAVIRAQYGAGFNANLQLGSPASTFGESHDIKDE